MMEHGRLVISQARSERKGLIVREIVLRHNMINWVHDRGTRHKI